MSIFTFSLILFTESRFPFHENTSSDSEEEILRRLKLAQSHNFQQSLAASQHTTGGRYNGTGLTHNLTNYSGLQNITIAAKDTFDVERKSKHKEKSRRRHSEKHSDPLGLAERGRIGIPQSSSDCSSSSSVEASVESNAGLVNGERKGNLIGFFFILSK